MTSALPGETPRAAPAAGGALRWDYDPWREHPVTAALAALSALALCALVVAARLPFLLAAALCIACLMVFAPALSPVECRVDGAGAARRGPLGWERRGWDRVRRIERVPAGVLLSPFPARHWLDGPRGLTLPLPAGRAGELLPAIEARRGAREG